MRRILLFLSVLILVGCSSRFRTQARNSCPGSGQGPIVCIDQGLNASPDPVHVKRGQKVEFFFSGGSDDLDIMADVLESSGHDKGHAWGQAKKDATLGNHKYTIIDLTSGHTKDPEIMIDP